jgi:L-lactate dehydrogenase complex protein LldE
MDVLPIQTKKLNIGLFVTCLVDLFRPQVGFAAVKLLEKANCCVVVPKAQTCCGQPAYNSGDREDTKKIAKQVITLFETFDYVVVPSGSCAGMVSHHYPALFEDDADMLKQAKNLAKKTYELTDFLVNILKVQKIDAEFNDTITYHDACSGLRELHVKKQPRTLLSMVEGLTLKELSDCEECCGFGGTFCVKYPDISNKMVTDKTTAIQTTEANVLLAGDLGCLLNIAGKLQRLNSNVKVFHIAEVLANMGQNYPGIGEKREKTQ